MLSVILRTLFIAAMVCCHSEYISKSVYATFFLTLGNLENFNWSQDWTTVDAHVGMYLPVSGSCAMSL